MNRVALYCAVNLTFTVLALIAGMARSAAGPSAVYVALLFATCSLPLLDIRRLNDRYALLACFSAMYFMLFGLLDMLALPAGGEQYRSHTGFISTAEAVILAGGLAVQVCFRLGTLIVGRRATRPATDWPKGLIVYGGMALWVICTWLSWKYKVEIMDDASGAAQRRGLASLSALQLVGYMIVSYAQPLSIAMVAYAYCRYRRPLLSVALIVIVLTQLLLGFVADGKSEALMGAVLIVLTRVLVTGRLPIPWLVAGMALIAIVFPVLQANREVRNQYSLNHSQAAQQIGKTLHRALEMKSVTQSGPERAQSFAERLTLKGSVELIVARTGHDVAYRDGYTLLPLVSAFVPRIVWPDKPDIETGRLVTRDFNTGDAENLYTSPSHLGELYWNFGWPGVLLGMSMIGLILGIVGAGSELSTAATLTRVLIVMLTLQQLIMNFESSLAAPYTVWIRSLVALGLVHLLLSRSRQLAWSSTTPAAAVAHTPQAMKRFKHLLD